jgi:RHS repeat-associated protein
MKKLALLLLVFAASGAVAQIIGIPRFGSIQNGGFDKIDNANLNVMFAIPVVSTGSRGVNLNASIPYNSLTWAISGTYWLPSVDSSGASAWGWGTQAVPVGTPYFHYRRFRCIANDGTNQWSYQYNGYGYRDPNGTVHTFSLNFTLAERPYQYPECGDSSPVMTAYADDGSGYFLNGNNFNGPPQGYYPKVFATSGTTVVQSGPMTDSNGNNISFSQLTNETDWTDSIGRTALKVIAHPTATPQYTTYQYTDSNGTPQTIKTTYAAFNISTSFGCGKTEYQQSNVQLPVRIDLPDQSYYTMSYEPNTGRLSKITLPTGGYIQYTYSGGMDCTYGTPLGMTRVVNDGTTSATWTYSRSTDQYGNYVTVVTSPDGNDTRYTFGPSANTVAPTKVEVYQGHVTGGTLLQETDTNYGPPMTVTTKLGGVQKQTTYSFDSYGNVTQAAESDWGSGSPKRTSVYTYVTDSSYISANILDKVQEIDVYDGSTAGTLVAKTTINYDDSDSAHFLCVTGAAGGSSPCTNHIRGNPTRVTKYPAPTNPATAQTTNYQFDSLGNLLKITDAANDSTTISYADSWADSHCTFTGSTYAYPTSTTNALSQSTSAIYNTCTGTAAKSIDLNSQQTQYAYTSGSPTAGRLSSITDPLSNVTNLLYPAFTRTESKLTFTAGNAVTLDNPVTSDGLGRPILSQKLQASGGNYDTVETDYDLLGRARKTTLPFTAGLGSSSSTAAGVTILYDALGRPTQVSDSGGGTATYSYPNNDVLVTIGPAPTGENTKKRQYEYDGLGRLTAVCELTTGSGSGGCTMANSPIGYWTKYTYNALDEITGVTQNAQGSSQTRSFVYDGLGRMTSETNPENGTTTYTFDSDSTCTPASTGDLVKRQDVAGNVSCYAYDALHRVAKITYPSGPYASTTATKYFVYDSASISFNGTTNMANAKGRLAEAYTCTTCPGTKITDLAFSYSVRGETTDVYEWTTNSSGWYHVNGTYWASGALNQLSASFGPSNITYALDAAGRTYSVGASVGTSPVSSTYYNPAGQVTDSTLGSGDSDHYAYDPNTGRMTQYKFSIGTGPQNVIGSLGWNQNGSLGSLGIADPFNAANSQTCNYTHDDLSRIVSVNCGSIWSQSFGFDPFGNINKSGSLAFLATYTTATNRIATITGAPNPTYDANGNLLTITDGTSHAYTWDAEGKQLGIDTLSATYDALGRMVELNNSGSYTETVYGLGGEKLALMSGQTLQKSFIATPSGTAVFTSSGLSYFRHSDWLGSSRFASTTGRTMYSSSAYAPFGEQYAKAGSNNDQNFTGQQPDTTTGLYDFLFRRLSQTQGRWISPDPAGIAAVDIVSPQSWNRYAYVANNPLKFLDQFGLMKGPCSVIGINCDDDGGGSGSMDYFGYGDCGSFYMDGLLMGSGCNSPDLTSGQQQDTTASNEAHAKQELQNLTSCVKKLYGINLRTFVPVAPGSNGYFYGIDSKGRGISVETDVTHPGWYLASFVGKPQLTSPAGKTPFGANPRAINYVASDFLAQNMNPNTFIQTVQVHELGHSLDQITSGSIFGSTEESADRFENCVVSGH